MSAHGWCHGTALLPTQTRLNPCHPDDAEYFDTDQTALVLQDHDKPKRIVVATTFGQGGHYVGQDIVAKHDQRGSWIGDFTVIGIASFQGIRVSQGTVPDRKLPHWVFK